jgi:hypothetical protein
MTKDVIVRMVPIKKLIAQGYFVPGGRLVWFTVFGPAALRSVN